MIDLGVSIITSTRLGSSTYISMEYYNKVRSMPVYNTIEAVAMFILSSVNSVRLKLAIVIIYG